MVLQQIHGLVEVAFQLSHFSLTIDFKLSLSLLNGFLVRNSAVAFQDILPQSEDLVIKSGYMVKSSSRRGEVTLRAWVNERSSPGLCWMAFHFAEACANVLTIDAFDPVTETAEYKVCAIKVERVRDGELLESELVRQARP